MGFGSFGKITKSISKATSKTVSKATKVVVKPVSKTVTSPLKAVTRVVKPTTLLNPAAIISNKIVRKIGVTAVKKPATLINPTAMAAEAAKAVGVKSKAADMLRLTTPLSSVAIEDPKLRKKAITGYAAAGAIGLASVGGAKLLKAASSLSATTGLKGPTTPESGPVQTEAAPGPGKGGLIGLGGLGLLLLLL